VLELSIRQTREALARLKELLDDRGEIIITRRGRPVARVLPIDPPRRPEVVPHADLRASMPRLESGSEVLLREERDGR
jgi:prevent-host-death family protein